VWEMSRRVRTAALAAPLLTALLAAAHAPPAAALAFAACGSGGFECAAQPVPLDRSGASGGKVTLSVARRAAAAQPAQSAVVALAGGPGQATLPIGAFIARAMAPALGAR